MHKLPTTVSVLMLVASSVAMPAKAQSTNGAEVIRGEVCIYEDADFIIWEDPDCDYVYVIRGDMLIYTDHGRLPPGAAVPGTGARTTYSTEPACQQTLSPSGRASSQCHWLPNR